MTKIFGLMSAFLLLAGCAELKNYLPHADVVKTSELKPIWIKDLDPIYDSGNLPIGLQSPLIYEGIVYIGHNAGSMQAYELENGKAVWSEVDGSTYHAAPIAYKDQIIYGTVQGRVISRHYTTGKMKYSVDLGASIETKGVVYNGRIFFQLRNHQVFCLDVETGKILWGYKRSVSYLTTLQRASVPVIYKDKVLVGMADGALIALSIDEGVMLYESKLSTASKFVDVDNAPFIYNDKIYLGPVGSPLAILDPNTGKVLHKADFMSSRPPFMDSKLIGDSMIFGTPNGELIQTDKNLINLNKVKISDGVISAIVNFKNKLAVTTTNGEILLIDAKTLKLQEKYRLGHAYSAVFGDVESKENYLTFISSRNRLYTFH